MRNNLKQNNAITLIALVITILVLLILAGITITSLTGENGLLNRATQVKDKTKEAEVLDEVGVAWNAVQIDGIKEGWNNSKKAEELEKELEGATAEEDDDSIIVEYKGYTVTIDTKSGKLTMGEAEEVATGPITINKFKIKGTQKAPTVPANFYYVGGTVNKGYVISDNANDENKYASSEDVGTDLEGNQFVWVPVVQDQKITLKVTCEEDITSIKLIDPVGSTIDLGTVSGKTYNKTDINPTLNGGYKVEVKTANHTESKILVVRSLYAKDTFINEPLTSNTLSRYTETEDYTTSINNNGGFYIGRYEASYSLSKALSKPSTSTRTISSTALTDGMLWNWISQTDALSTAKAYNSTLNSSLLTGAAWDRTLGWLVETNNKTLAQVSSDGKDWGNYSNDTFSNNKSIAKSGEYSQTKANNIYDLAGNVYEWTTEAVGASAGVSRGGAYCFNSSGSPASYRGGCDLPSSSGYLYGFRLALYL